MILDRVLGTVGRAGLYLSNKPNRLRLRGGRIEVIGFVMSRRPESSILLGQTPYNDMWMPPQEGVKLNESFEEALYRGLSVECGIDVPADDVERERLLYVRSIRFLGVVPLAASRHGERLVADDATGTPLEGIRLRRKAYWKASVIVPHQDRLSPTPDGTEMIALRWFAMSDARDAIVETNTPAKARLLLEGLAEAEADLKAKPST